MLFYIIHIGIMMVLFCFYISFHVKGRIINNVGVRKMKR